MGVYYAYYCPDLKEFFDGEYQPDHREPSLNFPDYVTDTDSGMASKELHAVKPAFYAALEKAWNSKSPTDPLIAEVLFQLMAWGPWQGHGVLVAPDQQQPWLLDGYDPVPGWSDVRKKHADFIQGVVDDYLEREPRRSLS
jgi:hypothetical protein